MVKSMQVYQDVTVANESKTNDWPNNLNQIYCLSTVLQITIFIPFKSVSQSQQFALRSLLMIFIKPSK